MDIVGGLAAAAQALDIARQLREFDKSFSDAEFKLKIADLYLALSDTKMALADARDALQERDSEIRRLKALAESKVKTVRVGQYNYGINPDGKPASLPFCPTCEQSHGLQIQITHSIGGHNLCPKCKGVYNGRDTQLPAGFKMPDTSTTN
ncbi:hypothetical protein EOB59_30935 [Mesorhizobium sp. M7A.F.Ca.MR.176.00.0.0]|uniref:hypothetical protein n=1 Tax=Mesorhizobium sp. M7A.F.Ca.MR.176.00.0.0 TaxID=2496776 RepID=UPI000FD1D112|nr:hypothetical protein [Mesorhizobium sp. M7A.F.Ca.MR.176.00.0.0]RUU85796.1 hypothetical protein EOB59_30935 [Mesorhizobium sp. M7A.F.Ca.MR.176.00.0.0]